MAFHPRDPANDGTLVPRLRTRDESVARVAFEELFGALYAPLCRFAHGYVRDSETAEDVVCEVFASFWAQRDTVEIRTTLHAYLFGAVRHRALNVLRSGRRAQGWEAAWEGDPVPPAMGEPVPPVDDVLVQHADRSARRAAIRRAVETLSARSRIVVSLRWGRHLSFAEIAEILGTTPGAVQTQLSRALQTLRERLPDYLE